MITTAKDMKMWLSRHAEVVSVGTEVYLIGGSPPSPRDKFYVFRYDTLHVEGMSTGLGSNVNHQISSPAVVYVKNLNRIYIFGGANFRFSDTPQEPKEYDEIY